MQTMWQQLTHPDFLIYLSVDYPSTLARKNLNWTESEYLEQVARLQHAYDHADFIIDTCQQSPEETLALAISQLALAGIHPDHQPER